MGQERPTRWSDAPGEFTKKFRELVDHRGIDAERELIDIFGVERLKALYEGEDPHFTEALEAARILKTPISSFERHDPGSMGEFEVAIAELVFEAGDMDPGERRKLIEALIALPERVRTRTEESADDSGEADEDAVNEQNRQDALQLDEVETSLPDSLVKLLGKRSK